MRIRACGITLLFSVLTVLIGFIATLAQPAQTLAATSDTINFQARLELSNGAIAPDGTYNVEFNLYSNSGATGSPEWTEDHLVGTSSIGISVANGYLTANLGSITAFPSTINWDQQQWLTMDIGGTGSGLVPYASNPPSSHTGWDGAMTPALQLTAVPYAFRAGQLADPANTGATLIWASQGSANTLQLPNESGTLCTNASAGICSGLYIQNQNISAQSSASFDIAGAGTLGGNLTLTGSSAAIQGPTTGLTVNDTSGNLTLSTTTSGSIALNSAGTIAIGGSASTGSITLGNSSSAQTVDIAYGAGAATVNIANVSTAGNSVNIATSNSATADTIDIGTGATSVAAGKTINIGNGTPTGSGTNIISIGSVINASTTTIQGGVNSTTPTLSLQAAASGYIAIGTSNGNNIQIGSVGSTSQVSTVTIANSSTQEQTVVVGSTNSSSTTTLQGGSITQELTNTGDTISISNATAAFQVSNGTNNVFSVSTSTTTPQAVLGTNANLAGSLLFNTTSSGNPITLEATSDTTSGGYALSLPTSAPSAGLCLQTSSSYTASTGQLVFGLCSNANASISEVAYNDSHGSSSTVSSVTNSTVTVGDLIVVTVQIPSGTAVTSISGGDATNWARVGFLAGDGTVNRVEMWEGTVSSVGSSTISLSPSGSFGNNDEITETEYTAAGVNAGTSWGVDTEGTHKSTGSATVAFPTLEPQSEGELYEGYAQVQHTPATAGSSAGFSYQVTGQSNIIAYDPDVNPITSFSPTANQNASGEADTIGAIFTAYVSSTAINNTTVPQLANFNVEAVTSGAPAGVLQAALSDTSDNILSLYGDTAGQSSPVLGVNYAGNILFGGLSAQTISVASQSTGTELTVQAGAASSGTNVGGYLLLQGGAGSSTGSSGSVVVESNTNNSTTAFQIQNTSGTSGVLFNADTTDSTIALTSTNTTASLLTVTNNSATTVAGGVVDIQANDLTSGIGVNITGTETSGFTGGLLEVTANSVTADNAGIVQLSANALSTGLLLNISATGHNLSTGSLLEVVANGETTATSIVQISANGLTGGTALLLNSSSNSIVGGSLLSVTANSATNATGGLIQISGTALTTGIALNINAGTGIALAIDSGSTINLGSGSTGNTAIIKIPTSSSCSNGGAQGLMFQTSGGSQVAHICTTGGGADFYAAQFNTGDTDLAENYSDVNDDLQPGDLVALSNDGTPDGIVAATSANANDIVGVVSTAPGLLLSGINESDGSTNLVNPTPVALSGRVPTYVSSENGPIAVGDYLTISSTPGVAMLATNPGQTIGVALQSYNGSGVGTIEVKMEVGYYAGSNTSSYLQNGDAASLADLSVGGDTTLAGLNVTGSANFSSINASGPTMLAGLTVTGNTTLQGNLTVVGNTTLASLTVSGSARFGTSIVVSVQNGLSYAAGVAPSSSSPLFNGSSRPVKSISEVPQYSGLITSNNPNGTLTSGFDTTPGAFHSYYNWTTSQSTPQTDSMYVRIPIPTDFSGFTPNDQICYYVYTNDLTPSDSTVSTTFYDTGDTA